MTLFQFHLVQKLSQGFSAAWAMWPRKEAKKDAEKAWSQKVTTPETEDKVFAAFEWQIPMLLEREPQYRPLLASWLRGERWEDEKPAPKKVTVSPAIGRRLDDQIQHQNVTAQIQFLVSRGMSLEEAKRRVYIEQGWIKEDPS